jgi:hypothetical protein
MRGLERDGWSCRRAIFQEAEMNNRRHTVQQGDSPQRIERQYKVSWASIQTHPANAYVRTRKGYPIHPGDVLVIPNVPNAGSLQADVFQNLEQFQRFVRENIKLLMRLSMHHPARATVRIHSTALPKVDPATPVTRPGAVVGYKRALPKVRPSVVLTASIENSFDVLRDALLAGAVMTSGYRSDADQERVINNYFAKHAGPPTIIGAEDRRRWLRKEKGLIIARVGHSPHRTGLAFDLSGADLDAMLSVVLRCAHDNEGRFPLLNTIVERKQNCLHVNLRY